MRACISDMSTSSPPASSSWASAAGDSAAAATPGRAAILGAAAGAASAAIIFSPMISARMLSTTAFCSSSISSGSMSSKISWTASCMNSHFAISLDMDIMVSRTSATLSRSFMVAIISELAFITPITLLSVICMRRFISMELRFALVHIMRSRARLLRAISFASCLALSRRPSLTSFLASFRVFSSSRSIFLHSRSILRCSLLSVLFHSRACSFGSTFFPPKSHDMPPGLSLKLH
mmetsp:Transcript_44810/g.106811  ORF Transcript_44810/g.106811 Transcript_44810/m.106811 type:complete len:235 (+) Transcript_44810:136-840(+)